MNQQNKSKIYLSGFSMYDSIPPTGFCSRRYGEMIEGFLLRIENDNDDHEKVIFVFTKQQISGYDQEEVFIVSSDNIDWFDDRDNEDGKLNNILYTIKNLKKFPYDKTNCLEQFKSFKELITTEEDIYGMNYDISQYIYNLFSNEMNLNYVELEEEITSLNK